jgi:hypothetical protein
MHTHLLLTCIYVLSSTVTFITTQNTTKDYSFTYIYTTTIGNANQPVNLLVDTTEYDSFLFSNADRVYASKIRNETDLDLFKDNITINGLLLRNFTFSIKDDDTNLNNTALQGVLGLGVSSRTKKNEIITALQKQKLINTGIALMTTLPQSKIDFITNDNELLVNEYQHGCALLNASELNDKKYKDGWICEYTRLFVSSGLTWNESVAINGRALFDSTTMYIVAPIEYVDVVFDVVGLTKDECAVTRVDSVNDELIINCEFKDGNDRLTQLNDVYFMFEGFAYPIRVDDLFFKVNDNNEFTFKIKFRYETNNIWIFGYPFFATYNIAFDYDNNVIKFKPSSEGNNNNNSNSILNFTSEYTTWQYETKRFLSRTYNDKRKIIISGVIACVITLTVLVMIIRAFARKNNPQIHSELVEEVNK